MKDKKIKAHKVFNSDWTCKNFQYEVGKTYTLTDTKGNILSPELCKSGYHACIKISNCFTYYDFNPTNKIAEVELFGEVLGLDEDKQCSNNITIIKEVTWLEMLQLANSGSNNSGFNNSGFRNSGFRNSGNRNSRNNNSGSNNSGSNNSGFNNSGFWNSGNNNSGFWNFGNNNSGDSNSGSWNSGNRNSGFFNTTTPETILVFNKEVNKIVWDRLSKPSFIYRICLTTWIPKCNMSFEEKQNNPNFCTTQGYLKTFTHKEAWKNAFDNRKDGDIELLKALPNFDADIFEEITGIKID